MMVITFVAASQAGLVAHYGMGEAEGGAGSPTTLIDDVAAQNATLASGTAGTIVAEGAVAGSTHSLLLDGSASYETGANVLGTDHFGPTGDGWSIEAWVKPTVDAAAGGPLDFVLSHGHGGVGYAIMADGNQWGIFVGGVGAFQAAGDFTVGQWHHLALVKDPTLNGGATTLYVNGNQHVTDSGWIHWLAVVNGNSIGNQVSGGHGFIGQIDEVSFTAIPEPATMALLGLGALVLRRRK